MDMNQCPDKVQNIGAILFSAIIWEIYLKEKGSTPPSGRDTPLSPEEAVGLAVRYKGPNVVGNPLIWIEEGLFRHIDRDAQLAAEPLRSSKLIDPETFGGFLHETMESQNLSDIGVAGEMNQTGQLSKRIIHTSVSRWRRNKEVPDEERVVVLASVLKFEPGGEDEKKLFSLADKQREELREARREQQR